MDFYPKNPTTLRRLLTKRQSPCTQIFKTHPSNPTNGPMSAMNLPRNNISTIQEEKLLEFNTQNTTSPIMPPNNFFQSEPQTQPQTTQDTPYSTESTSSTTEEEDDEEGDGAMLEQVEKKVKTCQYTTSNLKSQRRVSYEEEKEESDHSTACDTRSEFNTVNEPTDFLLSPSMCHLPSREVPEMKLDDNQSFDKLESPNCHLDSNNTTCNLKKAQQIAHQIGHNLVACDFQPEARQKVKCRMNHQWEIDLSNIANKGCSRCEDLLGQCKEFARKNEGSCLNQEYDETIRYRCTKGHIWSLNHKNAKRRWCAQCAKEQRAFLKKKCEEDKVEREKQEEEHQRKLFEEAKRKAAQENKGQQPFNLGSANSGASSQKPMSTLEYFQRIDYEIESLAKKYTTEFMSRKEFTGDITYHQILQVYKIVIMPEQILQSYMYLNSYNNILNPNRFNLNADTLRSEFRRMAKMIHPDKNKHPQAGNAFQKVYKVYEVAVSRLEGNQQKI